MQPSDLWIGTISALGASATPVPYAEVYTGLKTGLIDAAENNYPSYETAKHYESAPVYSETMHVMAPEVVVFSKKKWDTLTPQEQAAHAQGGEGLDSLLREAVGGEGEDVEGRRHQGGAKVVPAAEIDRKAFVEAEKPVWDKFTARRK